MHHHSLTYYLLLLLFLPLLSWAQEPAQKRRVLILTDIENEPDDAMSMVRFMLYTNQFDTEGLVATTSTHQRDKVADWRIREIVEAYGKVRDNLLKHEPGYPPADTLLSRIKRGYADFGMQAVGPGKDSEGSAWIIEVVDRDDPRPVYVPVWGGSNCLAQALWKVKMTRSPEELDRFVSKLRVYTISDQDDAGPWLRKTFPNLFYIASPGYHAAGAYHYATWSGISGDQFHGRFGGADFSLVNNDWVKENIQNHGPLGAQYPLIEYLMEGDTPSFLWLIENGLSDPEHPNWGSWGGRYELYQPRTEKWFYEPETRPLWTDAVDEVLGHDSAYHTSNKATLWRWREAFQNDFAARMDWTVQSYKKANHPPVAKLAHDHMLTVREGETVQLSAEGSSDPDKDALRYEWLYYPEPGTYAMRKPIPLEGKDQKKATFVAPSVPEPQTIHIILKVTDAGTPALTRYQRVIVTVLPKAL
ncbi:Protein of unknown function [Catalinimonas alkaloidigena]|uniref:DUF1593 domain-containing protein n=1 Tax=Catalinimonas alkaloidigena TaxID=1075417 RepID=A0A1G9KMG4_9BACT|nr:DUF1593 domain-containing protein [Catalinimonas alkaloidigena]SDL50776.1 Protein of unknown function [Catalinimonas alkaloidigena]